MIQQCMSVPTTNELDSVLNEELLSVVKWVHRNKLVLNVFRTKSMIIESNYTISKNPELHLTISDVSIKQLHETELLGIVNDSKFSWTKHKNKITDTAWWKCS